MGLSKFVVRDAHESHWKRTFTITPLLISSTSLFRVLPSPPLDGSVLILRFTWISREFRLKMRDIVIRFSSANLRMHLSLACCRVCDQRVKMAWMKEWNLTRQQSGYKTKLMKWKCSRWTTLGLVFAIGLQRMTQHHAFLDRKAGNAEKGHDYSWRHLRVVEEHRSSLETWIMSQAWHCSTSGLDLYQDYTVSVVYMCMCVVGFQELGEFEETGELTQVWLGLVYKHHRWWLSRGWLWPAMEITPCQYSPCRWCWIVCFGLRAWNYAVVAFVPWRAAVWDKVGKINSPGMGWEASDWWLASDGGADGAVVGDGGPHPSGKISQRRTQSSHHVVKCSMWCR